MENVIKEQKDIEITDDGNAEDQILDLIETAMNEPGCITTFKTKYKGGKKDENGTYIISITKDYK
jgi:hypothetical protein